jgi:hypothetical protein
MSGLHEGEVGGRARPEAVHVRLGVPVRMLLASKLAQKHQLVLEVVGHDLHGRRRRAHDGVGAGCTKVLYEAVE